jgi:hypothetical protein
MPIGTCRHCKKENVGIHMDHPVPISIGGDRDDKSPLCHDCHERKNVLEKSLMTFYASTPTILEWFGLAFNNNQEEIEELIRHLEMKAAHMTEVLYIHILKKPWPPTPPPDPGTEEAKQQGCVCLQGSSIWGAKLHNLACPLCEIKPSLFPQSDPEEKRADLDPNFKPPNPTN